MSNKLMRFIILLIILNFFSAEIFAKDNLLLHCLAKEEENLHKEKNQTILYRLNQNFINELVTSNDLAIKKKFVEEICNSEAKFPTSVGLLRLLLLNESDVFDLSLSGVDPNMRPYKMSYIREFQKQIPHFFISYLAGLQAEMPDAFCLTNAIPEIAAFNERLKYLEEEISIHEILSQKNKIESIFTKLLNLKAITANCKKMKLKNAPKKKSSPLLH
jgi:hypothetical protein